MRIIKNTLPFGRVFFLFCHDDCGNWRNGEFSFGIIKGFGSGMFGIYADAPFSDRKVDGFFFVGRIEDDKDRFGNFVINVAPDVVCGKVIVRDIHDRYMGIDVFGGSHTQSTGFFSETDKSLIII